MKNTETKSKYIEARAAGDSIRKAAQKAGISHATGQKWEKDLTAEIESLRREQLQEIYTAYGMTRAQRAKALGKLYKRLSEKVEKIDLDKLPPSEALRSFYKALEAVKGEIVPPLPETGQNKHLVNKGDQIRAVMDNMNARISSGDLLPEQSSVEIRAAALQLQAFHDMEITERLDKIEQALQEIQGRESATKQV